MKKVIRIVAITLASLLLLLIVLPFAFQDNIKAAIQEEIARQVQADISIGDVGLSFLRHFPLATISIEDLRVVGHAPFAGDTLIAADNLGLAVDLMSVVSGEVIDLRRIFLNDASISVKVLADGRANYDIVPTDSTAVEEPTPETEEASSFAIALQGYELNRIQLRYEDETLPMVLDIQDLTHKGKGDFTAELVDLVTSTQASSIYANYDGVPYLNRTKLDADFNANLTLRDTMTIDLRDNQFTLNDFTLSLAGLIQLWEEDMNFDLRYGTDETDFRSLMSLIPAIYTEDFGDLQIDGSLGFDGTVKGLMTESRLPGFGLNLQVKQGRIQYPDLPEALTAIALDLGIDYPGGSDLESLAINLQQFHAELGTNPLDAQLQLKGLERMALTGQVKTDLDLASLTKMFPLEGTTLRGQFSLDATADGVYDEAAGTFPQVSAVMDLRDGYLKDAEYPAELTELGFHGELRDVDGALTSAALEVPRFHFLLDGEPMDGNLQVVNFDNPTYLLRANGQLDLEKLIQVYPIDSMTLAGKLFIEDFETQGSYAAIEAERYTELPTSGTVRVQNLMYADPETPQTVIESGTLAFTPDHMELTQASGKIGRTDFQLDGELRNYLGFALLEGEILRGNLSLTSTLVDVNEFMTEEETPVAEEGSGPAEAPSEEVPLEVFPVPADMDIIFRCDIDKVLYDNLSLDNLTGTLEVVDQEVDMEDLQFDMLDGRIAMNGLYNTQNPREPQVNFYLDIAELSIPKAFEAFASMQRLAPALEKVNGVVNTEFGISGPLDEAMMPKLEILNGLGKFQVLRGQLLETPMFSALSDRTKLSQLTPIDLKDLQGSFRIEDGYLIISPLDLQAGQTTITLGGRQSLAGNLDYSVAIDAPAGQLGQAAFSALNNLVGTDVAGGDRVQVDLAVGGSSQQPKITGVGSRNVNDGLGDELADQAANAIEEKTGIDVPAVNEDSLRAEADRLKQAAADSVRRALEDRQKAIQDSLARVAAEARKEAERKAREKAEEEAKKALEGLKDRFGLPGRKKKN